MTTKINALSELHLRTEWIGYISLIKASLFSRSLISKVSEL